MGYLFPFLALLLFLLAKPIVSMAINSAAPRSLSAVLDSRQVIRYALATHNLVAEVSTASTFLNK